MTKSSPNQSSLLDVAQVWKSNKRTQDNNVRSEYSAFSKLSGLLRSSVPKAKAQLAQVMKRVPQVVVKVTKGTHGSQNTFENFTYISRNGKVPLYDQDGREISSKQEMKSIAKEWHEISSLSDSRSRRINSPDARRIIFSMPQGTDPKKVLSAVRATARTLFEGKYDYVYALHTDEGKGKSPNPHVHLTVMSQDYDGKRLQLRRGDLLIMRKVFALELRQRGIEVDASPQIARGKKIGALSQKSYHINQGASGNSKKTIDTKRKKTPYVSQAVVRLYLAAAEDLLKTGDESDKNLALEIKSFVNETFKINETLNDNLTQPNEKAHEASQNQSLALEYLNKSSAERLEDSRLINAELTAIECRKLAISHFEKDSKNLQSAYSLIEKQIFDDLAKGLEFNKPNLSQTKKLEMKLPKLKL